MIVWKNTSIVPPYYNAATSVPSGPISRDQKGLSHTTFCDLARCPLQLFAMSEKKGKVVVAMSGGVDSSVAAFLLVEQGYEVIGLFMRHGVKEEAPAQTCDTSLEIAPRSHQGCCSALDAGDARFVAGMLDIPFYSLNFEHDFDELIDYFSDEYAKGRTPNPCIVCNDKLKFGRIVEYADAVGADYIATGHYAQVGTRDGKSALMRGVDDGKDQSYVLFGLTRDVLDRVLFPIGQYTKPQIRELAAKFNLPNRDKPDSVEICFVPDRDYARIVKERRPDAFTPGDVVDDEGNVMGQHNGIGHYTVGQRRGLGIAAANPIYINQINVGENTITVGEADSLLNTGLVAERVSFLIDHPGPSFRAEVKIRYLHRAAPATVQTNSQGEVEVLFDEAQRAITPGQACVFYDGDVVIGGGWIERALRKK